jgi:sec-independent protein translocase protein TatB
VFDIGVTKLAIVGGIALIVIGPEKLPGLARTFGTMLGRARRYVADVKEEVNRSMDLDELRKAQASLQDAAQAVQSSIHQSTAAIENSIAEASAQDANSEPVPYYSFYRPVKKRWRTKIGATPQWYKARNGVRTRALSGAARVARFRPPKAPLDER